MSGAQAIVKILEQEGIPVVFGYPGAGNSSLFDAFLESNIKVILPRSEQAAAHQASGYAQVTGGVGVCTATSGPGATNLLTGIATAYMDSIPMIALTGQVPTGQIGYDAFQEVDIVGASHPFSKHSYLVTDVNDIPRIMKEAFYIAKTGRSGPVLIDLPLNVSKALFEYQEPGDVVIRGYNPTVRGNALQIKKFHSFLSDSEKPVIIAGGGVVSSGAATEVSELVRRRNIPVVTTLMGISATPAYGEFHLGMLGAFGNAASNRAIAEADLVIAIGARFNDRAYNNPKAYGETKVIHIDIDPAEIGKCVETHLPIVGDVKTVMGQVLEDLEDAPMSEFTQGLIAAAGIEREYEFKNGYVNPKYAMNILSKMVPEDAVLTTEVGQNQIWASANYRVPAKGKFLTSGGLGTMGFGLPAAIGAKVGVPEKVVIAVEGDGSLQMMLPEFATMRQWEIPLKIIIFRNEWLGMVREYQKNNYESRYSGVDLAGSPDFIELAKVYGIPGERVCENEKVEEAFARMLQTDGSYIVELVVDKDERSL